VPPGRSTKLWEPGGPPLGEGVSKMRRAGVRTVQTYSTGHGSRWPVGGRRRHGEVCAELGVYVKAARPRMEVFGKSPYVRRTVVATKE
jgi:hypothetical protein